MSKPLGPQTLCLLKVRKWFEDESLWSHKGARNGEQICIGLALSNYLPANDAKTRKETPELLAEEVFKFDPRSHGVFSNFNDAPGRTIHDIRLVLDRAIAVAIAKGV